ncbi:hypothetical protein [Flindersiella endophytica]
MTHEDNQITQLLREVVPQPPGGIDYDEVVRKGRRQRAMTRAAIVAAVAGCVLAAAAGVPALVESARDADQQTLVSSPPTPQVARFHGITYAVPAGWQLVEGTPAGSSLPENRTVAVGDTDLPRASISQRLQQTVQIRSLYSAADRSSDFYLPAQDAGKVSRNGQPGWLEITTYEHGKLATLTLPWLNAIIVATAPDEQAARALVNAAELPSATTQPEIPAITSGQGLELRNVMDPQGKGNGRLTDQAKIRGILAELSSLAPLAKQPAECGEARWLDTYVLVVRDANGSGRDWSYLIRGDVCRQVNGPEGSRAGLSEALWTRLSQAFELGES